MFIEIETIDGHTIGYKLSAEDMQLDLSYDPEFDYEKLAHLLNIGSDEKSFTADKLKNLPPILLAKLKQKFINSNKKRKDVNINVSNFNKKMKQ